MVTCQKKQTAVYIPFTTISVLSLPKAGQTAAEFATTLGCVHTVSVLRQHGANFQLKNRRDYTAVEVAEILGNTRCHGIASGAEDPLPGPVLRHRHLLLREGL